MAYFDLSKVEFVIKYFTNEYISTLKNETFCLLNYKFSQGQER